MNNFIVISLYEHFIVISMYEQFHFFTSKLRHTQEAPVKKTPLVFFW